MVVGKRCAQRLLYFGETMPDPSLNKLVGGAARVFFRMNDATSREAIVTGVVKDDLAEARVRLNVTMAEGQDFTIPPPTPINTDNYPPNLTQKAPIAFADDALYGWDPGQWHLIRMAQLDKKDMDRTLREMLDVLP